MARFITGDLTKGDLAILMEGKKADVIYSDPPWDDAWVSIFRKRAGKELEGQNIQTFLESFVVELKKYAKGIVYLEMGMKNINLLRTILKNHGAVELNLWKYPLGKGYQYLWRGYFNPGNYPIVNPVFAYTEKEAHARLVKNDAVPGGILLDPCIGIGRAYDIAKKVGMDCYGMDISKVKIEKLSKRIK